MNYSSRRFFSGFKEGMLTFGSNISIIVNSILLLIVYLLGVGITSMVAKLFGKHFLETRISKQQQTYWSDLSLKKKSIDEYYRQF